LLQSSFEKDAGKELNKAMQLKLFLLIEAMQQLLTGNQGILTYF
jgi:hypothetical protein